MVQISMNLQQDFENLVKERLKKQGYKPRKKDTNVALYCILSESISRLITEQVYQVHYSDELIKNPFYGEKKLVVDEIVLRLQQGKNVSAYLTDNILKPRARDHLLNHWGIHHLHLEPIATIKNKFVKRSARLLFVRVSGSDIYLIDICEHTKKGDEYQYEFENIRLLEIVDRNWPTLHQKLFGLLPLERNLDNKTIRTLRYKNISKTASINGQVIIPNGAISMAGNNIAAIQEFDFHQRNLQDLSERMQENIFQYFFLPPSVTMANITLLGILPNGYQLQETITGVKADFVIYD